VATSAILQFLVFNDVLCAMNELELLHHDIRYSVLFRYLEYVEVLVQLEEIEAAEKMQT
jgi:hypothetical protein